MVLKADIPLACHRAMGRTRDSGRVLTDELDVLAFAAEKFGDRLMNRGLSN